MPEIKRIVEIREVCYYDGTNGQYIVDTFFGGGGYTFVSESGGVLTLHCNQNSSDVTIEAGNYAVRNGYGDTQWRYTMTQYDLDQYYAEVGRSYR